MTGSLGDYLLVLHVVDLLCGSLNCRLQYQPVACRQSIRRCTRECKNWCDLGEFWARLVGLKTNRLHSSLTEPSVKSDVHKRFKDVEIKYHWIREHVDSGGRGIARLVHVESMDQATDLFTKVLCGPMFEAQAMWWWGRRGASRGP